MPCQSRVVPTLVSSAQHHIDHVSELQSSDLAVSGTKEVRGMSGGEQGWEITLSTEAYWSPMRLYAWWTCRALVTEDIATVTAWTGIIRLPFLILVSL